MNLKIIFTILLLKNFNFFKNIKINETMIKQYDIIKINGEDIYFFNKN